MLDEFCDEVYHSDIHPLNAARVSIPAVLGVMNAESKETLSSMKRDQPEEGVSRNLIKLSGEIVIEKL